MRLAIEKAIYGGAGLARLEGKAVFVPMVLPGETVEAAVRRDKASFAEAELLEVLEASPDRVSAPCPYYGACGGCQYQHAAYGAQLGMKRDILLETLGRAGLRDVPAVAVHAGEPWGYRNRIRLHVDAGTSAVGYRRRGSHALLAVESCPIAAPLLEQALRVVGAVFQEQRVGGWCAGVELFMDESSSALLLSLEQRDQTAGQAMETGALERVCVAVRERMPELRGVGLFAAKAERATGRVPGRVTGRQAASRRQDAAVEEPDGESAAASLVAAWGERGLRYRVGAETYWVTLGAFFQGNRFLADRLVELVGGDGSGALGSKAWDLFAGVGLFARVLARRYEQVVAVEGAPVSAGDLRRNVEGQRVVESSTLAFLERAANRRGEAPERVVLDPPRAGLGVKATGLLAGVRSQSITYVSCDPATLARDLRVLVDAGYILSRLHLVDMFPQTFHVETVAELRLG